MSRLFFPALLSTLLLPAVAHAKDLRSRFGVGFEQAFGQVSALSVRYGIPTNNPAINVQVEGLFGLSVQPDKPGEVFTGGRAMYGLVAEDNMNLYAAAGVGALTSGESTTIRLQPGLVVDFFLFGLENLGFTAQWGVNLDLQPAPGLATSANIGAGLHYWF